MLKKSLIAIAILAIALPSFAADVPQDNKVHGNWPCTYVPVAITKTPIDVLLDVGYYIWIQDTKAFKVTQDDYKTYSGCKVTNIQSNFPALISASVNSKGTSPAGGKWSVTKVQVGPVEGNKVIQPGPKQSLEVCVKGTEVQIQNLVGGDKSVKVTELTIYAVPTADCTSCAD
jgi:hypothetical protein